MASLFDDIDLDAGPPEVPQAVFDDWPDGTQLAYCAARDDRNALKEPDRAEWYRERAQSYRDMIK